MEPGRINIRMHRGECMRVQDRGWGSGRLVRNDVISDESAKNEVFPKGRVTYAFDGRFLEDHLFLSVMRSKMLSPCWDHCLHSTDAYAAPSSEGRLCPCMSKYRKLCRNLEIMFVCVRFFEISLAFERLPESPRCEMTIFPLCLAKN